MSAIHAVAQVKLAEMLTLQKAQYNNPVPFVMLALLVGCYGDRARG